MQDCAVTLHKMELTSSAVAENGRGLKMEMAESPEHKLQLISHPN